MNGLCHADHVADDVCGARTSLLDMALNYAAERKQLWPADGKISGHQTFSLPTLSTEIDAAEHLNHWQRRVAVDQRPACKPRKSPVQRLYAS